MSLPDELRERVRQRAHFACEYCGATEIGTAGLLTIDHFQPQSRDGSDAFENLVYCCHRCNEYKSDYWPQEPGEPRLWNPRQEPADAHFVELAGGNLFPISATGTFTLNRLRLNRPALIVNRLWRRHILQEQHLLTQLRDVLTILEQLQVQHRALLEENRALMQEQRRVLRLLMNEQD